MRDYLVTISATVTHKVQETALNELSAESQAVEWVATDLADAGYWDPDLTVLSVECLDSCSGEVGYVPMSTFAVADYTPAYSYQSAPTVLTNGYVTMAAV